MVTPIIMIFGIVASFASATATKPDVEPTQVFIAQTKGTVSQVPSICEKEGGTPLALDIGADSGAGGLLEQLQVLLWDYASGTYVRVVRLDEDGSFPHYGKEAAVYQVWDNHEFLWNRWVGPNNQFYIACFRYVPPTASPTSSPTSTPTASPTALLTVAPTTATTAAPTTAPTAPERFQAPQASHAPSGATPVLVTALVFGATSLLGC